MAVHVAARGRDRHPMVAVADVSPAGPGRFRVDAPATRVPRTAWQKLSAGDGAKGHRYYDWAVGHRPRP
ncbi:hypothetical protein GCM10009549_49350 [Streptomyces thermoalcalitolerans]|uniref:Uncharacterized protein n=1 Tax=Streptomyces thermoalcalitolerans TaxID=65605 RepID=A0ABP3ZUE5_9ACTN